MITDALHDALDESNWTAAQRSLLEKMLAEFMYEDLIEPTRLESGVTTADETAPAGSRYELDLGETAYRFVAADRRMDSYLVHEGSVRVREERGGWRAATDPVQFFLDAREHIGTDELTAGHLVREYRNTLLADAHIAARQADADRDVTDLSYAELEGEMTGHPWITYNKGRIGFGYEDYADHAPEMQSPVQLRWLAVREDRATFETVADLSPESLLRDELGDRYDAFEDRLRTKGLDPDDYHFLPVHEWQWDNTIVSLYGAELADDAIVPLGVGEDRYLPAQSVRTFLNVDEPEKHNVKLPLRILNTLVWRGLPGDRTEAAPAVTEYVQEIRDRDPFLRDECELVLPGEIAGLNYDHPDFAQLDGNPYQYDELLGCVWRESVADLIREDERALTLSALMHVDGDEPVISRLVERSPLSLEAWLDELFGTMLPPLLHYLYRYGTVFSPHGENTILVLDDEFVPTRLGVKDFVDDVNVSAYPLPELDELLTDELADVLRTEPPEGLCQFIFSGLFICVYRYVSDVLTRHHDYPEDEFWSHVRAAIDDYQSSFPELEARFELFDLCKPTFTKLCLNRNRMIDTGYGDAAGRPHASEHGVVGNALYEVDRGAAEDGG
ncbi:IucA/IucC family protein [Haloferacaceae archaeon DSL9]